MDTAAEAAVVAGGSDGSGCLRSIRRCLVSQPNCNVIGCAHAPEANVVVTKRRQRLFVFSSKLTALGQRCDTRFKILLWSFSFSMTNRAHLQ